MKVSRRNWRRIAVDLSILFYISWQIRFLPLVRHALLRGVNVYRIRHRISARSIGWAIPCAIDTRGVYRPATNFRHSRYIMRVYRIRCPEHGRNERKLIALSGDLTSSCTVMSVKLPLHSPRREDTCCLEVNSQLKCGDVRTRLHGISLVNISWPALIRI